MQKLAAALAATAVAGIVSVYLWQELRAERVRTSALQQHVAEQDLLHARQPATETAPQPAMPVAAVTDQPLAPSSLPAETTAATRNDAPAKSISSVELMKDPAYREGVTALLRDKIAQNFPDLTTELDLSQDLTDKLMDIVANNSIGISGMRGAEARTEAQRNQAEEIRALLGDAKAQRWDDYQQSLPSRQQVVRLRSTLQRAGQPLNSRQQQQLITDMATQQRRGEAEAKQMGSFAGGTPRDSMSKMEQLLKLSESGNQQILNTASAYLNHQQLEALRTQQEQELNMTRSILGASRTQPTAARD